MLIFVWISKFYFNKQKRAQLLHMLGVTQKYMLFPIYPHLRLNQQNMKQFVQLIIMSVGVTNAQQLAYRTSYKRHKERLADIKHNVTGKDFYIESHPRPQDKKGLLLQKLKQEETNYQNKILKQKINFIKQRNFHNIDPIHSMNKTEQVRYIDAYVYQQDDKINLNQEFTDGQPVKCIIPLSKPRKRSLFESTRIKITQIEQQIREKRPQSFHRSSNSQKEIFQNKNVENEAYFNLPERNEQRKVMFNKTKIISPTQSCTFEISLIGFRLLITAYLMGAQNYSLTELLSVKKSRYFLSQYKNNYQELYEKIILEEVNNKFTAIRIQDKTAGKQSREVISEQQKNKQKIKIQNEFIKRNYYSFKKLEEEPLDNNNKKNQHVISKEKIEEVTQRLAAPKKHYIKEQRPSMIPKAVTDTPLKSKISIHIDSKEQEQRKKKQEKSSSFQSKIQSLKKNQTEVQKRYEQPQMKLRQTESITIEKESNISQILPPQSKKKGENEESEQGENEYSQQFQNTSEIIKNKNHSEFNQNLQDKTDGKQKAQIKKPVVSEKIKKQVTQQEYASEQYHDLLEQFQTKKEQEAEHKMTNNNDQLHNSKIDEEYAEEFQT